MRPLLALVLTLAAVAGAGSARAAEPRWVWPVAAPHPVVRGFEAPSTVYAAGHRGIDVRAREGSEVRAPDDGVVAFAGTVVDRGVVSIDHGGVRSSFEPVTPAVHAGDPIRRGAVLGALATGGTHPAGVLHIGARIPTGDGWSYVDPLLYLGGAQHAVLLPLSAFPEG